MGNDNIPLKSKFNGHLIYRWIEEKDNYQLLIELKEGFIKYIEEDYNIQFNEFLSTNSHSSIKSIFKIYYITQYNLNFSETFF